MHTNIIPSPWWDLTTTLSPSDRLTHLALLSLTDRDGLAQLSTSSISRLTGESRKHCHSSVLTLANTGLIAVWSTGDPPNHGRWWVWVVHALEYVPTRGDLSRTRDVACPAPSKQLVRDTLEKLWDREPTTEECKSVCPRAWGRVRPVQSTETVDTEVVRVWEAWRDRQERPGACVLGDAARGLISRALKNATADQLVSLFRYAWESEEAGPRYWRGANDRKRKYLGLDNLLVVSKLAGRIQSALAWEEQVQDRGVQGDGTDLGPWAAFRGRPSAMPPSLVEQRVGPKGTESSPDPRPKRLSQQCQTMLDLFRSRGDQGVRTSELAEIALKYTGRISELRGAGADIVLTERSSDGNNLYAMVNWATYGSG